MENITLSEECTKLGIKGQNSTARLEKDMVPNEQNKVIKYFGDTLL